MTIFLRLLALVAAFTLYLTLTWEQQETPMQSQLAPVAIFKDDADTHPWLIQIPKGRFTVGSTRTLRRELQSKDRHRPRKLRMEHSFFMMSTELSTRIAQRLKPGSYRHPHCKGSCPAVNISWREALVLANLLSEATGLEPCYTIGTRQVRWPKGIACEGYRLPLEEEWEYAAKAGMTGLLYSGGNDLDELGWYRGNSSLGPNEIARKKPNPLGLYDMSGNVAEWCWDGWEKFDNKWKKRKVIRGGSWNSDPLNARVEQRSTKRSKQSSLSIGVRFVRTIPADPG